MLVDSSVRACLVAPEVFPTIFGLASGTCGLFHLVVSIQPDGAWAWGWAWAYSTKGHGHGPMAYFPCPMATSIKIKPNRAKPKQHHTQALLRRLRRGMVSGNILGCNNWPSRGHPCGLVDSSARACLVAPEVFPTIFGQASGTCGLPPSSGVHPAGRGLGMGMGMGIQFQCP